MKKKYRILILVLFAGISAPGQVSFKKFFGNPSNADFAADIYQTPAGDYVVAGTTANGDQGFDMFVLETDNSGSATSFESYGGSKNEVAQRLVPLVDGGHLLLGYTESYGSGGRDGYALRLDASGMVLWSRTIGGFYDDQIIDGVQLADGSLVIAAQVFTPSGGNDIRVERWNAGGTAVLATFTMETGTENYGRHLLLTTDGILLSGIAEGQGFILKLNSANLSQIWFKNDYTTASASPQPLLRVEDLIPGSGNNRFIAVGRAAAPNVNTVFTIDENGEVISKFNSLLSGAVAECLARSTDGSLFIAGGSQIEQRDSNGLVLNAANATDMPAGIPQNIRSLIALSTGGVALVGNTQVNQRGRDLLFGILDTALESQSSHLYWNLGPNDSESGFSARQTADGGYLLCGERYQPDTQEDIWLIKTDATGQVVWEQTTGSSGIDVVRTLDLSGNNAFVVTGFSYDVQLGEPAVLFVLKFDLEGNELWAKFFPLGTPNFSTYALVRTLSDGGYLIALSAPLVSATRKPTLLRLNEVGDVVWSKTYDGFSPNNFLRGLIETSEGKFLGVGASSGGTMHATLFDPLGAQLWSYAYGGAAGIGYGVAATSDGHFILSGATDTDLSGNDSLYVARIDALGTVDWEQYIEGGSYAWPRVQVNGAGEIFLTSTVAAPAPSGAGIREFEEIRKLTTDGMPVWVREISGLNNMVFFESHLTQDEGLLFFGYADNNNSRDYCLVKTDADGIVNTGSAWKNITLPKVFPSPAPDEINISWESTYTGPVVLQIFDAMGRRAEKISRQKNNTTASWRIEVAHLPPGTYFVQLVTDEGSVSKPFIKG
ncbi:MAG: T9SS type A sorting domain-containing protein [Saprospiraceae bacterium]|nr:T9SS type A sorting domain-containing protein [Saprospiraceae bacterium]